MAQPALASTTERQGSSRLIVLFALLAVILIGGGILVYRFVIEPAPASQTVAPVKGLNTDALADQRLILLSGNAGDAPTVSDAEVGRDNPFAAIQK